jgi:hypothetical protein
VRAARRAATRFFASYLLFLYGRLPASGVADASESLQSELCQGTSLVTPAERRARPRLLRVTVVPSGPPASALASAFVLANGTTHPLTATLEPRGRAWIVVAVER